MADEQYDPTAHTVAEVNEYLATADDAEVTRVLDAEAAGKGRTSIKAPGTESAEETTDAKALETKAATFEEAASAVVSPEGAAYEKGYFGTVPSRDGDRPVDLTLAGVTGQNKDA